MSKYYIGLDIGSISTKGVLIDNDNNIIIDKYIWTEGDPINATKKIITYMKEKSNYCGIVGRRASKESSPASLKSASCRTCSNGTAADAAILL